MAPAPPHPGRSPGDPGAVLSKAALALSVEYRSRAQLPAETDRWWDEVLGVAHFGPDPAPLAVARIPVAAVPLTPLSEAGALCEIWRGEGTMQVGGLGAVQYRASEQLLFGCIELPERPPGAEADSPLESATSAAYAQVFAALEATGYRHLVRVWNYVSDINQPAGAGERYWLFNRARQDSFLAWQRPTFNAVPAASALGTPSGSPLVIYFLASRIAAQMLENPRQVSAYRYPAQYGPRSPTFSRAALLAVGGGTLLVSGTASILGHETAHADDIAAQTGETLNNIRALISAANRLNPVPRFALEALAYKVYLRHPAHLPEVAAVLRSALGSAAPIAYLCADVCRRDLLVEVEAVGPAPGHG